MASLLLIRHGQIAANRRGLWHGSTDSELTWRGHRQARKTARHLASLPTRPSAIYTSPLQRCRDTANYVARRCDVEPVIVDELREYGIGEWEGMPFSKLTDDHDFVTRATQDKTFAPPGGESLESVAQRIVPVMRSIAIQHETDEQILVVGHGAAMAIALGVLLEDDSASWTNYHFSNCSITELMLSPSPYVNFFNSTQHL